MSDGLKILKVEVENFKGLKPVSLDINGRSMMIIGPNGSNKSSFLQALMSPMNAKVKPAEAIKQGEERAHVELTIGGTVGGEEKRYDIELRFSQDHKNGRLIVKNKEGATLKSPKDSLAAIIGNISFDIDEFIRLSKTDTGNRSEAGVKKQVEILKSLLPEEIQEQLLSCDSIYSDTYAKRTSLNQEIRMLEAQNAHEFTDEELAKYEKVMDTEPIQKKINDIGDAMENWTRIDKGVTEKEEELTKAGMLGDLEDHQHNMDALMNLITDFKKPNAQENATFLVHCNKYKSELEEKINKIKAIPSLNEDIKKGKDWLEKNPKPTTEELMKQLNDAQEWNKKAEQVAKIKKQYELINGKKEESDKMTAALKKSQDRKKEIFASNPLPVPELSFDENQVLYKGLPLDENHHPSSYIIGIGVKIAMAMNPGLKVIMIKDGSLLDKSIANFVLKTVEEAGYQLFIEMVRWEGGDMEMNFIEKEIK